jgi:hypothetical protein
METPRDRRREKRARARTSRGPRGGARARGGASERGTTRLLKHLKSRLLKKSLKRLVRRRLRRIHARRRTERLRAVRVRRLRRGILQFPPFRVESCREKIEKRRGATRQSSSAEAAAENDGETSMTVASTSSSIPSPRLASVGRTCLHAPFQMFSSLISRMSLSDGIFTCQPSVE